VALVIGGVVVVAAIVVVAVVLFVGGRAEPGTVVTSPADSLDGTSTKVLVPAGAIEVTVGDPVDSYEGDRAPRGGGFVPVRLAFDSEAAPAALLGILGGTPEQASVVLVSGDSHYDLPAPYRVVGPGTTSGGGQTFYVAVADTDELRIEVTYDGLTQSVDPATGDIDKAGAAGLYEVDATVSDQRCPADGWRPAGVQLRMDCAVTGPVATPYDPKQGWAKEGRTWLFAGVDLRLLAVQLPVGSQSVEYLPRGDGQLELSIGGAPAVRTVRETDTSAQQLFDVASGAVGPLHIESTHDLERADDADPGPRDRTVTLSRDIDVS
jgi:hypothetical protein